MPTYVYVYLSLSFGKIAKIVPGLLKKGQVGPCTFVWVNLVLQPLNLGSVMSLIQTAVSNTVKSTNRQLEKTHFPPFQCPLPHRQKKKKGTNGRI